MTIGSIKNPTTRRAAVLVVAPFAVIAHVIVGTLDGLRLALEDIRSVW
ncbi:hypothetical protein ACWX0K_14970 [Nitrobacteraceae bacterium UC4446_H13]